MATLEEIFGSEMVENTIFEELSKKAPIVRTTKNKKAMVRLGKPYSSYHFQEVDMNDDNFMIMYKMLNEKDEDGNETIEKISSFEVDPVLNENGKINVVRIRPQMKKTENGILYANLLICESMDRLLYRMITLNNGQKPMSARHQIEILAGNIFDFDHLGSFYGSLPDLDFGGQLFHRQ